MVPFYAPGRILAVIGAENLVKLRTVFLKSDWAAEELLCCHGEELGFVLYTVSIEKGFVPIPGELAQPKIFTGADLYPFGKLSIVGERRSAVGGSVEHIKLVGELVKYHIMALFGVTSPMENSIPHKYYRPLSKGLTQNGNVGFNRAVHAFENAGAMFRDHDG